jgi:hypothetical protein
MINSIKTKHFATKMTHLTYYQSTFVLLINICIDALIIVQYDIVFKRDIKCTKILND